MKPKPDETQQVRIVRSPLFAETPKQLAELFRKFGRLAKDEPDNPDIHEITNAIIESLLELKPTINKHLGKTLAKDFYKKSSETIETKWHWGYRSWPNSSKADEIALQLNEWQNISQQPTQHKDAQLAKHPDTQQFRIDPERLVVTHNGSVVGFTPREINFLEKLNNNPGAWYLGAELDLGGHANRIKNKINEKIPDLIESSQKGYRLNPVKVFF